MLWDPIRNCWVAQTPEEEVRQKLIQTMIGPLGYPKSLLSVEKQLPGVDRRFDLVCFTPGNGGLIPLLLIECKAGPIDLAAERQVLGYNDSVQAPFVCLVNGSEIRTLWRERGKIASIPFLPSYAQLVEKR